LTILVVLIITVVLISYVRVSFEPRINPQIGPFRNTPFASVEWRDA
jgi:hypothetical protein